MPMLIAEVCSTVKIINRIENGSSFASHKWAPQFDQADRAIFIAWKQIRSIDTGPRSQTDVPRAATCIPSERMLPKREPRNIQLVNSYKDFRQAMRTSSRNENSKGGEGSPL